MLRHVTGRLGKQDGSDWDGRRSNSKHLQQQGKLSAIEKPVALRSQC